MQIKKIQIQQDNKSKTIGQVTQTETHRPMDFSRFVGQEHIVKMLKTAMKSAKKSDHTIWHILFSGSSGYGKTTLATIIANEMNVQIKAITWYAIAKPAELISILNNLQLWDILFIDEIHRLKPNIEEVLYIAMEDRVIDFVMPEWWNMRLPINQFTLIGATTKLESLSAPLKNRFVYKFHFEDYEKEDIIAIIQTYLDTYNIKTSQEIIEKISKKVEHTPREIHNICVKIRDYLIAHQDDDDRDNNTKNNSTNTENLIMHENDRPTFEKWLNIDTGGITPLHKKYLAILAEFDNPVWVKTLAARLGMNEKAIENDIEPLLLKLGKIEKTTKGRILR